jgi:hypothetical protein
VLKIDQHQLAKLLYKLRMAEVDISLNFECPNCGAAPREVCELNTGTPRFASHIERWDIAKKYEQKIKSRSNLPVAARKVRAKRS